MLFLQNKLLQYIDFVQTTIMRHLNEIIHEKAVFIDFWERSNKAKSYSHRAFNVHNYNLTVSLK